MYGIGVVKLAVHYSQGRSTSQPVPRRPSSILSTVPNCWARPCN